VGFGYLELISFSATVGKNFSCYFMM